MVNKQFHHIYFSFYNFTRIELPQLVEVENSYFTGCNFNEYLITCYPPRPEGSGNFCVPIFTFFNLAIVEKKFY